MTPEQRAAYYVDLTAWAWAAWDACKADGAVP